jgi:hypothetical protein
VYSPALLYELAEIEAALEEEREARQGLCMKEAFFGKGNFIRFQIAFWIFLLQQWGGQNSVGYYAPQIFTAVSTIPEIKLCAVAYGLVDRLHRNKKFATRIWHLWCREGGSD